MKQLIKLNISKFQSFLKPSKKNVKQEALHYANSQKAIKFTTGPQHMRPRSLKS